MVDARIEQFEPFSLTGMGSWVELPSDEVNGGYVASGGAELIFDVRIDAASVNSRLLVSMTSGQENNESDQMEYTAMLLILINNH